MKKKTIKRYIRNIARLKIINFLLRRILKLNYIAAVIPQKYLEIIPVSGVVSFSLPNSKKVRLKSDGNDLVLRELYWTGIDKFEGGTIPLFIKLLKFTRTFLDIGANTGLFSLIAAIDNYERKVYSFEPVSSILPYLKENIKLNQLKNLQICSSAVTNYDGEITLYIPQDVIPTSASTIEGFRETERAISVPALTLDSFTTKNNLSSIDLFKIDTETTEHLVLEGAKQVLERDEPMIICEVLKEAGTEKSLQGILEKLNYKYYLITNQGLIEKNEIKGNENPRESNYLFIPEKKIHGMMKQIF